MTMRINRFASLLCVFALTLLLLPATGRAAVPPIYRYVSNYGGGSISRIDSSGVGTLFISSNLQNPTGIVVDSQGNLYVANEGTNEIRKFNPLGAYLGVFASTGGGSLP